MISAKNLKYCLNKFHHVACNLFDLRKNITSNNFTVEIHVKNERDRDEFLSLFDIIKEEALSTKHLLPDEIHDEIKKPKIREEINFYGIKYVVKVEQKNK